MRFIDSGTSLHIELTNIQPPVIAICDLADSSLVRTKRWRLINGICVTTALNEQELECPLSLAHFLLDVPRSTAIKYGDGNPLNCTRTNLNAVIKRRGVNNGRRTKHPSTVSTEVDGTYILRVKSGTQYTIDAEVADDISKYNWMTHNDAAPYRQLKRQSYESQAKVFSLGKHLMNIPVDARGRVTFLNKDRYDYRFSNLQFKHK